MPTSQTILITGCSSGFGMLAAARLASNGHHVFATMRDLNKQDELLREVSRRQAKVTVLPLDVTKEETIKQAVNTIRSQSKQLDVVVNNAGFGFGGFFEDLTQDQIREQFDTNFFGVQNVVRETISLLKQSKGSIINISSISGFTASPGFSAYASSKWALEAFSESLRGEMKLFDVDVYLIEPGSYRTKIFEENARYAKHYDDESSPYYPLNQHLKQKVLRYIETCKKDPEEVVKKIEYLINHRPIRFRHIPDVQNWFNYWARKYMPYRLYEWTVNSVLYPPHLKPEKSEYGRK